MKKTQRIILTGAPGTGKTTLLDLLQEQGYPVHTEMARALIKEQQEKNSNIVPWEDHKAFGDLLFQRQKDQYFDAVEGRVNFFDRGIPDNLGYLRRDGLQNHALEMEAAQFPYFRKIFLTPPWKEIYNQDDERWEDFELMLEIHEALLDIYHHFKYQVVEIPRTDPDSRLDFILSQIEGS